MAEITLMVDLKAAKRYKLGESAVISGIVVGLRAVPKTSKEE